MIQAFEEPPEGEEDAAYIGEIAKTYLRKFATKDEADRTYGLYDKERKFYIGNKLAIIVDNDLVVGKDEYEGTPGLWELTVSKNPDKTIYTPEDKENYAKLMVKIMLFMLVTTQKVKNQKAVSQINGSIYLVKFGLIGESMKEVDVLLFRAILTRC